METSSRMNEYPEGLMMAVIFCVGYFAGIGRQSEHIINISKAEFCQEELQTLPGDTRSRLGLDSRSVGRWCHSTKQTCSSLAKLHSSQDKLQWEPSRAVPGQSMSAPPWRSYSSTRGTSLRSISTSSSCSSAGSTRSFFSSTPPGATTTSSSKGEPLKTTTMSEYHRLNSTKCALSTLKRVLKKWKQSNRYSNFFLLNYGSSWSSLKEWVLSFSWHVIGDRTLDFTVHGKECLPTWNNYS